MALVSFSTTRNTGDRSLPAEVASPRLARSAETNPGKAKNKKKLFTKFKNRRLRKATTKKARRKDKISQNKSKKDRKSRKAIKNVSKKAGKKSRKNMKNNEKVQFLARDFGVSLHYLQMLNLFQWQKKLYVFKQFYY